MPSENKVDSFFSRVKNHPILSVIVIFAICVSALASFTESMEKISRLFIEEPKEVPSDNTAITDTMPKQGTELDSEYHYRLIVLTNDGCLFFKWDSSSLATLPEPAATTQAMMLMNLDRSNPITVVGYGDRGNTPEYSLSIGERRADMVRDMLISKYDYDPNLISVISEGLGNTAQVAEYLCGVKIKL